MRIKIGKRVQKGISNSDEINITCVWNAGIASLVPNGTSILFFVIISTMIGPRFTEGAKSNLIFCFIINIIVIIAIIIIIINIIIFIIIFI